MDTYDFLSSSLALPTNALAYSVSERLSSLFPDQVVLEGEVEYCDVEKYARAGFCRLETKNSVHNQIATVWEEDTGLKKVAKNVWYLVTWRGQSLEVLILTWCSGYYDQSYLWIIADDEATAEAFFSEVSDWNAEVRDEILVFDGGYWSKSDALFRAIRTANFENLVLAGTLKEEIRRDLSEFFAARETYDRHGVPWKRGVLFVGPPGNGKTHAVKAVVNALGKPCLYVKSFTGDCSTDHDCIRRVFKRARKSAPCVLVFEDLDSLINEESRSFFLNELDGFAANTGVLTVATTNHPERLDPAIVNRPSRFDRKYHFNLPGADERLAYIRLWGSTLADALRPSEAGLSDVVARTEGFSFAYLKELFLSGMMRWMALSGDRTMDAVLLEQSELLRTQMATDSPKSS